MTQPGYEIGRDARGFTLKEREVLHQMVEGKSLAEAARTLSLSRQRVYQVVKSLENKGVPVEVLRRK
jgi:DNA-binding CsgD family transcriptional regulator